jgi:hypothetical protein
MAFAQAPREMERSVAEDRSAREQPGRAETPKKTCDELFGPEKVLCLKKGGSVKTGAGARSAATQHAR